MKTERVVRAGGFKAETSVSTSPNSDVFIRCFIQMIWILFQVGSDGR